MSTIVELRYYEPFGLARAPSVRVCRRNVAGTISGGRLR